jgi:hypothetical protein
MAIPGGSSILFWVDAFNIKINPKQTTPPLGVKQLSTTSNGTIFGMLIATKTSHPK